MPSKKPRDARAPLPALAWLVPSRPVAWTVADFRSVSEERADERRRLLDHARAAAALRAPIVAAGCGRIIHA